MACIVQFVPRFSPKQSEIVDDLRRRIITGELLPGTQLPGLVEICRQYKTSEVTALRAMARTFSMPNSRTHSKGFPNSRHANAALWPATIDGFRIIHAERNGLRFGKYRCTDALAGWCGLRERPKRCKTSVMS